MSQARKRTLTFQTPKKKAMTPLRTAKSPSVSASKSARTAPAAGTERDDESIENRLIEAYREENAFLRSLKADAYLYSKLLGITIGQEESTINFKIQRSSTTGQKKLEFTLEETGECYVFTLKEAENCNIPEYFYDVIEFEKKAFPQFFYKAMQAIYETRTNDN